jgi:hypothetical protein
MLRELLIQATLVSSSSIYAFFRFRLIAADSLLRRILLRRFSSVGSRLLSRFSSAPLAEAEPVVASVPKAVSAGSWHAMRSAPVIGRLAADAGADWSPPEVKQLAGGVTLAAAAGLGAAGDCGCSAERKGSSLLRWGSPGLGTSSASSTSHMSTSSTGKLSLRALMLTKSISASSNSSDSRVGLEALLLLW